MKAGSDENISSTFSRVPSPTFVTASSRTNGIPFCWWAKLVLGSMVAVMSIDGALAVWTAVPSKPMNGPHRPAKRCAGTYEQSDWSFSIADQKKAGDPMKKQGRH